MMYITNIMMPPIRGIPPFVKYHHSIKFIIKTNAKISTNASVSAANGANVKTRPNTRVIVIRLHQLAKS